MSSTNKRERLAGVFAVLAGMVALSIPAAADATVVGVVTGDTAVLTGDAANDNIVIGVAGPNLSHNLATATGFESSTDFDSANAGIQSLTTAAALRIDGGQGDDNIVGGQNADDIIGGEGSDRLTGFRGNDTIEAGSGNDVMIWNNGDGSDTNEGNNGVDEMLIVTSTAHDDMKVNPQPVTGRTKFERVNAHFTLDMGTTERLSISSSAGNDKLATAAGVTLPITVDSGLGADTITTGEGADVIQGGGANDTLVGSGGRDVLVGGDGADTIDALDGEVDAVNCGADADSATADGIDSVLECEAVTRSDGDNDGHVVPSDCDDADPSRHPGAVDVPGNRIDEDCDGVDAAVNFDRDRDGINRPTDCNDDNPAISPVAIDVPQNGLNEDCSLDGRDADYPLIGSTIRARFKGFRGAFIKFKTLKIVRARAGSTIRISCSGRGCPFRSARRYMVKADRASLSVLRRVRAIRLYRRTRVEVRVTRPDAVGLMNRWRGLAPRLTERCLPPRTRPQRC